MFHEPSDHSSAATAAAAAAPTVLLMRRSSAGQFVLERKTELSQWPLEAEICAQQDSTKSEDKHFEVTQRRTRGREGRHGGGQG